MSELSKAEQLKQKRIYWKRHIESWQESGLTQTEYCRRYNLKGHQLVYWKKRFVQTESGVTFVPLKLDNLMRVPAACSSWPLRLIINDGLKVEIGHGFDPHLLRQLIITLQGL